MDYTPVTPSTTTQSSAPPVTVTVTVPVAAASASLLPDDWQEDSTVTSCHHCSIKFSILTRKHHCRSCGLIHCDNCSKYRSTIPSKNYQEKVRVCGKCYYTLKKQHAKKTPTTSSTTAAANTNKSHHRAESKHGLDREKKQHSKHASSSSSHARSASPPSSTDFTASELQLQLSALHSLHSSYQPEHQFLTSLLSNANQLEQTYVATIGFLYAFLQEQQSTHLAQWKSQQQIISTQQKSMEHMEEIIKNAGLGPHLNSSILLTQSNNRSSRGASPTTNHTGSSVTVRSASPSQSSLSTNPNPSSRSYPSSHHFHGQSSPTTTASASSSILNNQNSSSSQQSKFSPGSTSSNQPPLSFPFPPLPFTFASPSSAATTPLSNSGFISPAYDAASEEAYLEPTMDHQGMDNTHQFMHEQQQQSSYNQQMQSENATHTVVPMKNSSRHAAYKPPPSTAQPQPSFATLTVNEPPSPTHRGMSSDQLTPTRMKRASSNPTALTPPENNHPSSNTSASSTSSSRGKHHSNSNSNNLNLNKGTDPSVHKLLDEVGM